MTKLNHTICIRRWQADGLIGMTGFAVGNALAKTAKILGI